MKNREMTAEERKIFEEIKNLLIRANRWDNMSICANAHRKAQMLMRNLPAEIKTIPEVNKVWHQLHH